jgi:uncharacterized protein YjbJ (UPF0337 family)
MDEDVLKGKWKEIKGGVKAKWGKLTDNDLTELEGNTEKLVGLLQQRYGYPNGDETPSEAAFPVNPSADGSSSQRRRG